MFFPFLFFPFFFPSFFPTLTFFTLFSLSFFFLCFFFTLPFSSAILGDSIWKAIFETFFFFESEYKEISYFYLPFLSLLPLFSYCSLTSFFFLPCSPRSTPILLSPSFPYLFSARTLSFWKLMQYCQVLINSGKELPAKPKIPTIQYIMNF